MIWQYIKNFRGHFQDIQWIVAKLMIKFDCNYIKYLFLW